MTKRDLPRHCYAKSNGMYFQRRGVPSHRFKATFGTPEFWAEYAYVLRGKPSLPPSATFAGLVTAYKGSADYTRLADRTGGHPFTDDDVRNVAASVWDWTQRKIGEGQYFVGAGRYLQLSHDAIDRVLPLGADAFMLFMVLKRRSDHRQNLIVANDMRLTMPDGEWTLVRFRRARQILIDSGVLKETRPASTWHGPATYAW